MANIAKGIQAFTKLSIKAAAAVKSGAQALIAKSQANKSAAKKTTAAEVARKKAEAEARMLAQSKQKAAEAAARAKAKTVANSTSAKKTTQTTISAAKTGVVLLQWHDVQFYAKSNQIRGLKSFTVSSSIETEDEEIGDEKITKLKKKKGYTSSITAYFDIRLGISDVKAEAMKLLAYGTGAQTGYLSCCGAKLIPTIQMMKDAKVQNVVFAPDGRWISCEVVMNFVNRSKLDGTTTSAQAASGGGEGGGGGGSSGGGGGGGNTYTATVYYSASSGAVQSVTRTSTVSYDDALKKAYAAVPKNAQWASTNKSGATNQSNPSNTPAATQAKTVAATVQKAAQKVSSTVKAVVSTVAKAVPAVSKIVSTIGSLFKKK